MGPNRSNRPNKAHQMRPGKKHTNSTLIAIAQPTTTASANTSSVQKLEMHSPGRFPFLFLAS